MENWKVALVSGAAGVGTAMFLKKKWTAGIILAGVGLGTLASEYPEKFAEVRKRFPDLIERGNSFLAVATRVGDRLGEAAENRNSSWYETLLSR
jgi:L-asparaginase/Glu-tRNA(Gln) amidotransferase subunit D